MMKDKLITINPKTSEVFFENGVLGIDGENLQGELIVSFTDNEFVNGTARLEMEIGGTKSYAMMTKVGETYTLPIKSFLTKNGRVDLQVVITEGTQDEEIPIFKSRKWYFVIENSINAEIEQPDEYDTWISVANSKLNEIDNVLQDIIDLRFQIENGDLILTVGGENNG